MNLNLEPPTEASVVRVKVACINWDVPNLRYAPKAAVFVLRDGALVGDSYYPTWAEAMDKANNLGRLYGLARTGGAA